ncbi:MAG: hypothetical protein AAFV43_10180 [Planctomycetota bacterium]
MNYRELKRRCDLDGRDKTVSHLSEALTNGDLSAEDFSIRELAEALIPDGSAWVRSLDPRDGTTSVTEASDGIDPTAFQQIAGQLIHTRILESYQSEAFVASRLVSTIPTRLDGEKIPGVTSIADQIDEVGPGMPYPSLGFEEDYVETPSTANHGFIVPVTREAIFFDRTNLILARAAEVGEVLGLNKEKRLLDVILGVTNPYVQGGVALNTYLTSGPWVNYLGGNEIVDWTNIDRVEQLFNEMLDPATGEPVLLQATSVLISPSQRHAANRVLNATEINYAPTGSSTSTLAANPLRDYAVYESRLMYRRLLASGMNATNAKDLWLMGDFKKAFAYMENWPITVTQAPLGSEADFTNDIVMRFKASERGAAAVLNPRYVVQCG